MSCLPWGHMSAAVATQISGDSPPIFRVRFFHISVHVLQYICPSRICSVSSVSASVLLSVSQILYTWPALSRQQQRRIKSCEFMAYRQKHSAHIFYDDHLFPSWSTLIHRWNASACVSLQRYTFTHDQHKLTERNTQKKFFHDQHKLTERTTQKKFIHDQHKLTEQTTQKKSGGWSPRRPRFRACLWQSSSAMHATRPSQIQCCNQRETGCDSRFRGLMWNIHIRFILMKLELEIFDSDVGAHYFDSFWYQCSISRLSVPIFELEILGSDVQAGNFRFRYSSPRLSDPMSIFETFGSDTRAHCWIFLESFVVDRRGRKG